MEIVFSLAVGVLGGSGVWLVLRPRTFQVILGLSLVSYAVNLFIFSMGSLSIDAEPIVRPGVPQDLLHYTDPMPQALVLTAIVIGFALFVFALAVLKRSWEVHGNVETDRITAVAEEPAPDLPAPAGEDKA